MKATPSYFLLCFKQVQSQKEYDHSGGVSPEMGKYCGLLHPVMLLLRLILISLV